MFSVDNRCCRLSKLKSLLEIGQDSHGDIWTETTFTVEHGTDDAENEPTAAMRSDNDPGAGMLLFHGVETFERWVGETTSVDTMNDALRDT